MSMLLRLFFVILGENVVALGWKLLRGLGFAAVTFTGVQLLLETAKDYAFTQLDSLPANVIMMCGLLKLDVCLNIYFSCYVARAIVWGLNQASDTRSTMRIGGGG